MISSRSGMGGIVGLFEALLGHVGVNLRGRERGVTEQRLHAAEIRPRVQQMRGETVAERVRLDGLADAGFCCSVTNIFTQYRIV